MFIARVARGARGSGCGAALRVTGEEGRAQSIGHRCAEQNPLFCIRFVRSGDAEFVEPAPRGETAVARSDPAGKDSHRLARAG